VKKKLARLRAEFESFRQLMDERDASAKASINAALAAINSAGDKTEVALREYKVTANEWRGTLNDVITRTMTRADWEREHRVVEEKIQDLREYRSGSLAATETLRAIHAGQRWLVGFSVATLLSAAGLVIHLFVK